MKDNRVFAVALGSVVSLLFIMLFINMEVETEVYVVIFIAIFTAATMDIVEALRNRHARD